MSGKMGIGGDGNEWEKDRERENEMDGQSLDIKITRWIWLLEHVHTLEHLYSLTQR